MCEHLFVDNPNDKGNVAEMAIALKAMQCGLAVSKPMTEHTRYDLVFEINGNLKKVQCKRGRLTQNDTVIDVNLASCRYTPAGRVTTKYGLGEVDFVAVYCDALDRCYLLPEQLFVDRSGTFLRLQPTKNGQRSCINLAADYEFEGAVAQLVRAPPWHGGGQGFESPQLHSNPPQSIGSHEFRTKLGYYLDLAAQGQELTVTRWGRRFLRITLWQPELLEAAAA